MEEQVTARPDPDSDQDDDDNSDKDNNVTAIPKMKRRQIPKIGDLERRDRYHLGSLGPGTSTKK